MPYIDALSKVLPVILLMALGAALNRSRFLQPATVQELKKMVINITLPAVLFLAFARASFQSLESAFAGMYTDGLRKEALGFLNEPVYNTIDSRGVFEDPRGGRP